MLEASLESPVKLKETRWDSDTSTDGVSEKDWGVILYAQAVSFDLFKLCQAVE